MHVSAVHSLGENARYKILHRKNKTWTAYRPITDDTTASDLCESEKQIHNYLLSETMNVISAEIN